MGSFAVGLAGGVGAPDSGGTLRYIRLVDHGGVLSAGKRLPVKVILYAERKR